MASGGRLDWFRASPLGLFVHWGIASVAGVDLSWGAIKDRPWTRDNSDYTPDYWDLAAQFQPERYNPDHWLSAAREAGMTYAVLTAKHHDGYTLWPSDFGEFGVKQHMKGRDLVGEFVDACRRQGIKVGLYFSLPDWSQPDMGRPHVYDDWKRFATKETLDSADELVAFERYVKHTRGQIRELMTRYGTIDIAWFDGLPWNPTTVSPMAEIDRMIRYLQPNIIIGRGEFGEYATLEPYSDDVMPDKPIAGPWEVCQSLHACGGWGYYREEKFLSSKVVLSRLSRIVGGGGNYLLNIGPKADGELPDCAYAHLAELADWMRNHRSAVCDVEGGPWPARCDVPVTRRRGVWFVHVPADHKGEVMLRDVPRPTRLLHLRTQADVDAKHARGRLKFDLSSKQRKASVEVVAISWSAADHEAMSR